MIAVRRLPTPLVLERNAARWLAELQTVLSKPAPTKKQISRAQNRYRHDEVKQALVAMFHGKCAYCESKITVVTYGAIEHFRPKSQYIELTFAWENFLLSCDVCNDAGHKGTHFPLNQHGEPLLIDPTDGITDPHAHLDFVWDGVARLASEHLRSR